MNTLNAIIKKYKQVRNLQYLNTEYQSKYAFIGIGSHAIQNLYPIISFLNVSLKYIVCTSSKKANMISKLYYPTIGTYDIDIVLQDKEVKGIFVCVDREKHFDIALKCLKNNKHLFIEKPCCHDIEQLKILINESEKHKNLITCVGLQKRYSPLTKKLCKWLKNEYLISYNYRYLTGAYVEGDVLTDIFLHPLDYVTFMFGKANILGIEIIKDKSNRQQTIFLILQHDKIKGILELSTSYSWSNAMEKFSINTYNGIYEMENFSNLTFTSKQQTFCSIPLEKIFRKPTITKTLFSSNNFNPIIQNNQIYKQGYFNEIQQFITSIEQNQNHSRSTFSSLENSYMILDTIRKYKS